MRTRIKAALGSLESNYGKVAYQPRYEPMDELVCCILSQHTSDANSFPAFDRMKAAFPTWEQVVAAGAEGILPYIKSAGLANQKSKAIVRVLEEIKARNGAYTIEGLGAMPMREAREWLESLPHVGPKTASIVLSFSFAMEAIPVDTHIYRVSKRLRFVPATMSEAKSHDELLSLVEPEDAFRYHVLLIEHGRKVCKARRPLCGECAIAKLCPSREAVP